MTGQSSPSPGDEAGEFWFDSGDMSYAVVDDETKHYLVLDPTGLREQIARTLGEHELFGVSYCTCSPEDADGAHEPFPQRYWEDHLADAVLALLAGFAAGQGTT